MGARFPKLAPVQLTLAHSQPRPSAAKQPHIRKEQSTAMCDFACTRQQSAELGLRLVL